jgi:hypothetical protein
VESKPSAVERRIVGKKIKQYPKQRKETPIEGKEKTMSK